MIDSYIEEIVCFLSSEMKYLLAADHFDKIVCFVPLSFLESTKVDTR